ncbi:hypothetical protein GCM10022419_045440 [Nonomuraea rosea]|uniref:Transcriptional regulator n=1 Tax=Nonomuraea rosea TaxID=638574 RepID=A0ABP6X559_9ACTN
MPQVRVMDDDADLAAEVVEQLVELIARADSGLRAGSITRLRHRGGGGRFVVDVEPSPRSVMQQQSSERRVQRMVFCEAHHGAHEEMAECVWPHDIAPPGAVPQVGHPLRSTD